MPSVFLERNEHHISKESFSMWQEELPTPKSLLGELERWMRLWRNDESNNIPSNFIESLRACDMDSFPNIHHLILIGCTLPITSAEAERTFSLLRRIKVYTRSTLTEERFSDLGVIVMHYDVRWCSESLYWTAPSAYFWKISLGRLKGSATLGHNNYVNIN